MTIFNRHKVQISFRQAFVLCGLAMFAPALAGCVGGTTYGTEKSHEVATLEGVYNIMSFGQRSKNIDYKARPDLVIPADKKSLPQPIDDSIATDRPDWPEAPEAKRARLRAKANANENEIFQAATDDDGTPLIGIEKRKSRRDLRCMDRWCDDNDKAKQEEVRKRVLAMRDKTKYSKTGQRRRFLTEPPDVYRARSGVVAEDDFGLDSEVLKRRKEEELANRKPNQNESNSF